MDTIKGAAPDSENGAIEQQQSTVVFPKGNPIPSVKALTFYRHSTFDVDVVYADVNEIQSPAKISTYTIGPFQSAKGERAKLKLKVRLNLHGIASVESATMLEEEEVEVPVSPVKEPSKMEVDETLSDAAPAAGGDSDVSMHDTKACNDASAADVDNGAPETEKVCADGNRCEGDHVLVKV